MTKTLNLSDKFRKNRIQTRYKQYKEIFKFTGILLKLLFRIQWKTLIPMVKSMYKYYKVKFNLFKIMNQKVMIFR